MRIIFVMQWHETPYGPTPVIDAESYHKWASEIANGNLLRSRAFYQSPLYPYLLGFFYGIITPNVVLASALNIVLDASACALLALVALSAFGPAAGLATGLFAALNKSMIFWTAPVMKEPLANFMLATFLLCALQAWKTKETRAFFITGLTLGLAALVRGNLLILAPAFLGIVTAVALSAQKDKSWLLRIKKTGGELGPKIVLFCLGLVVPVIPVTLHNAWVSRDFVPISYMDGFNFYLGHFEKADGISYVFPDNISSDPELEEMNAAWIASEEQGRALRPSEVSAFWRQKAFEAIRSNPKHEVELAANKIFALWNNAETFDNYDPAFIKKNFPTILNWNPLGFWIIALLLPLAVMCLKRKKQRQTAMLFIVLAAAYAFSLVLFYVTDRYRFPLFFLLLPLAGAGLMGVWQLLRAKDTKRLVAAACIAAVSLTFSLWPRTGENLEAYNWGILGKLHVAKRDYENAVRSLEKSLELSPVAAGVTPYIELAFVKEQLGQKEEAEKTLLKGRQVFPDNAILVYELGRQKAASGEISKAAAMFRKAIEISPYYSLAYYALAAILMKENKIDEAKMIVSRGLSIEPSNPWLLGLSATINE